MRRNGNWVSALPRPIPNISPFQMEIIEGHLLGDGCLIKPRYLNDLAYFSLGRTLSDKAYLAWSYNNLVNLTTGYGLSEKKTFLAATQKHYFETYFSTRCSFELSNLRKKWYPDGRKHIPQDLTLTPLKIALWLADDGHIRQSHKGDKSCVEIIFATHCFLENEVKYLASLLCQRYDAKFNVNKTKSGHQITTYGIGSWRVIEDCHSQWPDGIARKKYWKDLEHNPQYYLDKLLWRQTHCLYGHEYTPDNTLVRKYPSGGEGVRCKRCLSIRRHNRYLLTGL